MTADRASDEPASDAAGTAAAPMAAGPGFGGLIGQPAVGRALQTAIERQRLPHALLFTGPPGVGKATCAGVLAQAVNCPRLGPTDGCGECVSCSKLARGLHPDLLWIERQKNVIHLAQITFRPDKTGNQPPPPPRDRTVTGFVGYAPFEGARRVVVIRNAEHMKAEAQNALLKTLEEPPRSSLLILTTAAPANLLPTVRSRCQSLRFAPVPQKLIRQHLERTIGCSPEAARQRAALAPGSIGGALRVDLDAHAALLGAVVEALRMAAQGGGGVIEAAETLSGLGSGDTATQKAAAVLRVARDVLRDLLHVTSGADLAGLVDLAHADARDQWGVELEPEQVTAAADAVARGIDYVTGPIAPNIKMALEKTLFEVGAALAGSDRPARARG